MSSKVLPLSFLSSHTHALHELSWLVEFCMFRNLFVLIDFSTLFSIEMLSDCVINGLYMRVLKLTWKNLISVNFLQFSDVSV
jgi:hypothetical protein